MNHSKQYGMKPASRSGIARKIVLPQLQWERKAIMIRKQQRILKTCLRRYLGLYAMFNQKSETSVRP